MNVEDKYRHACFHVSKPEIRYEQLDRYTYVPSYLGSFQILF